MDKGKKAKYAPGMDDTDIIPLASKEDRKKGTVTKEVRVFLEENRPSGKDLRDPD